MKYVSLLIWVAFGLRKCVKIILISFDVLGAPLCAVVPREWATNERTELPAITSPFQLQRSTVICYCRLRCLVVVPIPNILKSSPKQKMETSQKVANLQLPVKTLLALAGCAGQHNGTLNSFAVQAAAGACPKYILCNAQC